MRLSLDLGLGSVATLNTGGGGLYSQMVAHSTGANDPLPDGGGTLPSESWYAQGRVNPEAPETFNQIYPWFQAYRAKDAALDADVLIKVANLNCAVLSISTGLWTELPVTARPLEGGLYPFDYGAVDDIPASQWSSDPAPFITQLEQDRVLHLFGSALAGVTSADIAGYLVSIDAKLVSKSGADIVASSANTIILGTGLDCYQDGVYQGDAFVGSLVPLTTNLRKIYGTTLTVEQLRASPPPSSFNQFTQTDAQTLDPDIELLGPELLPDRLIEVAGSWDIQATWAVSGGLATRSATGAANYLASSFVTGTLAGSRRIRTLLKAVSPFEGGAVDVYVNTAGGLSAAPANVTGVGRRCFDNTETDPLGALLFAETPTVANIAFLSMRELL